MKEIGKIQADCPSDKTHQEKYYKFWTDYKVQMPLIVFSIAN